MEGWSAPDWYIGEYEDNTRVKRGDMESGGLKTLILPKFLAIFASFKGLASTIRDVRFRKGKLYTNAIRS